MRILALLAVFSVAAVSAPPKAHADSFAAATSVYDDGTNAEAGYEWCRRSSLSGAKRCALDACENNSDKECELTIWCEPGAWSGVVALKSADGVKHVAVCEKSSRNGALKALKTECRAFRRAGPAGFKNCVVESLVSPDSNDSETNVVTWKYRNGDIRRVE